MNVLLRLELLENERKKDKELAVSQQNSIISPTAHRRIETLPVSLGMPSSRRVAAATGQTDSQVISPANELSRSLN